MERTQSLSSFDYFGEIHKQGMHSKLFNKNIVVGLDRYSINNNHENMKLNRVISVCCLAVCHLEQDE